jgi:hypothetical protein
MYFNSSRYLPVPNTTQVNGFSARKTGTPVSLEIKYSKPRSRHPPPVRIIPRSTISAESSGGVFSRTRFTPSNIWSVGSLRAFLISLLSSSRVLGNPEIASLPFYFHCISSLIHISISDSKLNIFSGSIPDY